MIMQIISWPIQARFSATRNLTSFNIDIYIDSNKKWRGGGAHSTQPIWSHMGVHKIFNDNFIINLIDYSHVVPFFVLLNLLL